MRSVLNRIIEKHGGEHSWAYKRRFYLLLAALLINLLVPSLDQHPILESLLTLIINASLVLAGINFISQDKHKLKKAWLIFGIITICVSICSTIFRPINEIVFLEYLVLFVFFIVISLNLILQVVRTKHVTPDVIIGVFCGYLLLGTLAFFAYYSVDLLSGDCFRGIEGSQDSVEYVKSVYYFSFISLTTIGFGDITPISPYIQRLTIFFGALGQFYMAVIVAIMVSKYMSSRSFIEVDED